MLFLAEICKAGPVSLSCVQPGPDLRANKIWAKKLGNRLNNINGLKLARSVDGRMEGLTFPYPYSGYYQFRFK